MIAHGMIYVAGGVTAQALTTTPTKLTCFAGNGDHDSADDGDMRIQPSVSTDSVKVKPGNYLVHFTLCGSGDDIDFTFFLRKNGVKVGRLGSKNATEAAAGDVKAMIRGLLTVNESDLASDGLCPIEVYGEGSGSGNLTPTFAQLAVLALSA